MADPAPAGSEAASGNEPPPVDGSTPTDAGKPADGRTSDDAAPRFVNTRQNIALIADPTRGPRFTMTKRESGLVEDDQPASATETGDAETSSSTPSETADDDAETAPASADGPAADAQADIQDKVPIDSAKTFIGDNGTYYDESWRWMHWRGTRRSWNWPAALSFGQWLAYRRLHRYASLHLLWIAGLAAAAVNDMPVLAVTALGLLGAGLNGVYGNILYFSAFRRAVDHVTNNGEGSYDELQGQLAAAGGTSLLAVGVMATLSIAGIAAAIAATHHWRGALLVNFWPFF